MKNIIKLKAMRSIAGIIAVVAIIGFSFAACDNGSGGTTGTAPAITTASLPNGTVGVAYSQTLAATGDAPITWSVESGALPDGLSLSGNTIAGTPAAANTFNFTVKATNEQQRNRIRIRHLHGRAYLLVLGVLGIPQRERGVKSEQ